MLCYCIHKLFSAEGNIEASKPEDTETEGAEALLDFGPWTSHKRFRAEYVYVSFYIIF